MDKILLALAQFSDQLSELVIFANAEGQLLRLNQAAQNYFSVESSTLQSANLKDWLESKGAKPDLLSACNEALSSKKSFLHECSSDRTLNNDPLIQWKVVRSDHPEILLIGKKSILENELGDLGRLFNCIQETVPGNYWWKDINGVYRSTMAKIMQPV